MADTEIESIGPDDWEVFRDIRLRALADAPEAFGSTYAHWVEAPESRWRDRLTVVPFNIVARRDGALVGMASGVVARVDEAELISMWVEPAARGSGVAERLIRAVTEWASATGRSTCLMVRVDNERAIAAYERAGFIDVGPNPDQPANAPRENKMVHRGR